MSLARINTRGQITIPEKFRRLLNCHTGDYVEVIIEEDTLRVIPKELIDKSQTWFWTKEHQEDEEAAETELILGIGKRVENARNLIDELNK